MVAIGVLTFLAGCAAPTIKRNQVIDPPRPSTRADSFRHLRYLLYLPEGYGDSAHAGSAWPLILFLHGIGQSGDEIEWVARYGPPAEVEKGRELPFVIVSPQNPQFGRRWRPNELIALLDETIERYQIDEERIYLTGASIGGLGTWATAIAYPDRFAALAPVCAFGSPAEISRIAHIPVWAFHGSQDWLVPPSAGKEMVDAHRVAGGMADGHWCQKRATPSGSTFIHATIYIARSSSIIGTIPTSPERTDGDPKEKINRLVLLVSFFVIRSDLGLDRSDFCDREFTSNSRLGSVV